MSREKDVRITGVALAIAFMITMLAVNCLYVDAADYTAWSAVFDANYYYNNCADARNYAGKNADKLWNYFLKVGIPRGDQASEEFNIFIYAKNYPDLVKVYGNKYISYYIHYAQKGKAEGRNAKTLLSEAGQPATNNQKPQVATENSPYDEYRNQVVALVNQERAKYGLPEFTIDDSLNAAAQARANELTNYYSHTRPNGTDCFTIFNEYGVNYRACGENIAAGFSSPEAVVNGWMNSAGHRANILNRSYNHIGVGYVKDNAGYGGYKTYWSQMFTN